PRQKIEWRREWIVRPAFKRQSRLLILIAGDQQRGQDRLQDERCAARRSDRELVIAVRDTAGRECELRRADVRAGDFGLTDLRRGLHGGLVLPLESGVAFAGSDFLVDGRWVLYH